MGLVGRDAVLQTALDGAKRVEELSKLRDIVRAGGEGSGQENTERKEAMEAHILAVSQVVLSEEEAIITQMARKEDVRSKSYRQRERGPTPVPSTRTNTPGSRPSTRGSLAAMAWAGGFGSRPNTRESSRPNTRESSRLEVLTTMTTDQLERRLDAESSRPSTRESRPRTRESASRQSSVQDSRPSTRDGAPVRNEVSWPSGLEVPGIQVNTFASFASV